MSAAGPDGLAAHVHDTALIDTHEHLLPEAARLAGTVLDSVFPVDDWTGLLSMYLRDDLHSAGMPPATQTASFSAGLDDRSRFRLLEPYWRSVRNTGYGVSVRHTLGGLYGEDDLTEASVPRLAEKYRQMVRPGFYRAVLRDTANIEACQINSLTTPFEISADPDLLAYDLSILAFTRCTGDDIRTIETWSGAPVASLDSLVEAIDTAFRVHGPQAVAVKSQIAYARRLNFLPASRSEAEGAFKRARAGEMLAPEESAPLQNYLSRHCFRRAAEHGLPVKLHTGYYAGRTSMPMERLRQNAADLCPVLDEFGDTRFVLMHIGYPYQNEFVALAKHYPNAFVDLCWSWIISPVATRAFLKEFLTAAPSNKLFAFGGDYALVENVYGHSRIARDGITQALSGLVADGLADLEEARRLASRIMRDNALAFFPIRRGAVVPPDAAGVQQRGP